MLPNVKFSALKKQRKFYSSKKKRHWLKAQIVISQDKIICTAFSSGKVHDFQLFKSSRLLIADTGYLGLEQLHTKSLIQKNLQNFVSWLQKINFIIVSFQNWELMLRIYSVSWSASIFLPSVTEFEKLLPNVSTWFVPFSNSILSFRICLLDKFGNLDEWNIM